MPLLVRQFAVVERPTSGVALWRIGRLCNSGCRNREGGEPEQSPDEFHCILADLRSAFYGIARSIDEYLLSIEVPREQIVSRVHKLGDEK